jgi:hypothetical protein
MSYPEAVMPNAIRFRRRCQLLYGTALLKGEDTAELFEDARRVEGVLLRAEPHCRSTPDTVQGYYEPTGCSSSSAAPGDLVSRGEVSVATGQRRTSCASSEPTAAPSQLDHLQHVFLVATAVQIMGIP